VVVRHETPRGPRGNCLIGATPVVAKARDITLSTTLLATADEVIE
jgi:hypothetical protein